MKREYTHTLVEYECLKCGHRWTDQQPWDYDDFTGTYRRPELSPEERCKYWQCGECHVKGRCVVRRKEDRDARQG
jgi:hypothetical protein